MDGCIIQMTLDKSVGPQVGLNNVTETIKPGSSPGELKKVKCSGEHKNIHCCQCKSSDHVSYKVL